MTTLNSESDNTTSENTTQLTLKQINTLTRLTLVFIWIYHGLIPKLLFKNSQEVMMNDAFMPFVEENFALMSSGIMECIYGLALLFLFKNKWLLLPAMIFSQIATISIVIKLPELLVNAFNPTTLNLAVLVLAWINWITMEKKAG